MTDKLISLQAAVDEISKYASIWMEYDGGMTQEEVAEAALKAAKRTMVHILEELPEAVIRCKYCEYGNQDEDGNWFCRDIGASVGGLDGTGYCSDAERREQDDR